MARTALITFEKSGPAGASCVANDNSRVDEAARLRAAVGALAMACNEQAAAVRRFQEDGRQLAETVGRLQATAESYRDSLGRIDVTALNRKARRLALIADSWSAATA